jgi:hypothetical protein
MTPATLALALTILLAASLLELRRTRELHHGYFGAFFCFVGLASPGDHSFLVWLGLILLADDDAQHVWQAIEKLAGGTITPDFTPIHHLGSAALGFLEAVYHKVTGIFRHPGTPSSGGGAGSTPVGPPKPA